MCSAQLCLTDLCNFSRCATGGSLTSFAAPSLIDAERTLAEFSDHGRTGHSPKYFGIKAEPDTHGARG
eukprot:COSAG02_NODE_3505_length_6637_cov_2.581217_7_plen_68_part_00